MKNRRPTAHDERREAAWLAEHSQYGGRIHEEVTSALIKALSPPSSRFVGHALYLKLFAEFANALEVAGALGWAIRARKQHSLVLDAFLTYPDHAPREFYRAARLNRSGSLVRLLNLPPERDVVAALAATVTRWSEEECRRSLPECVKHAKVLAGRYFAEREIIRDTYNRAKHGATMLHAPSLNDREFFVLAPNLYAKSPRARKPYELRKFTVNKTMILRLESGTSAASALIRYLIELANALSRADLLYV
jgi:hypothetical protein